MLKSSALYIVIIISLVIGILCSALVASQYYCRFQLQKIARISLLENNMVSAINILLDDTSSNLNEHVLPLFRDSTDTVSIKKTQWGIFDIGICKAFIQHDSIFRVFSIAQGIDSAKWATLYLIDRNRMLSVTGKTNITGNVYIPKAGIKPEFFDNSPYEGNKMLIDGKVRYSDKTLPALSSIRINYLQKLFESPNKYTQQVNIPDSVHASFRDTVELFNILHNNYVLKNKKLSGNIIIHSDSIIVIDSTAQLNNVIIVAKAIIVSNGFSGRCQLFAIDSIDIKNNCHFGYPSCAGVLQFQKSELGKPLQLNISAKDIFNGSIFIYKKDNDDNLPIISISEKTIINGQIYNNGIIAFSKDVRVNGSVFSNRFFYKSSFSLYENYLVDVTLNSTSLSTYYLTSDLLPVAAKKKNVLEWLEQSNY